jgi:hypothetical protein
MEKKELKANFEEDLGFQCPICGKIVQPTDEDGCVIDFDAEQYLKVTPCPHLIWIMVEENHEIRKGWYFVFIRLDIATKIARLVSEDPATQYRMERRRIKISKRSISLFLKGLFEQEDRISTVFANLPIVYEQLLPPNSYIYQYTYSEYFRMDFAIEPDVQNESIP